jgi:HSP20 family protein
MYVTKYEPYVRLNKLQRDIDRLLGCDVYKDDDINFAINAWSPAVDIKEEESRYVLHADIPGVDPKDIEVTLDNGILTVKGHKETETKKDADKYQRVERFSGQFIRRFTLPDTVNGDAVTAKIDKGVLEITIPKAEKGVSKRIEVK